MSAKIASSATRSATRSTSSAKRSVKSTTKVDKTTTKKDVITFESDDDIAKEIPSSEASAVSDNEPSSESEASDAKENPFTINEPVNDVVEELTDSKPVVKKLERKKLTPRQEELSSRQDVNKFMDLIRSKYGDVSQVNVFAYTRDDVKVRKFTTQYGESAVCSVNVVRALVHTAEEKHELLAKELWELFECTPRLNLWGRLTANIRGASYAQIFINGKPFTTKNGKIKYGHNITVYTSDDYIQAIKKRIDQFNDATNNNAYKSKYPWHDDSELIGDAKPCGLNDF